jgi:hypothetical protein
MFDKRDVKDNYRFILISTSHLLSTIVIESTNLKQSNCISFFLLHCVRNIELFEECEFCYQ